MPLNDTVLQQDYGRRKRTSSGAQRSCRYGSGSRFNSGHGLL